MTESDDLTMIREAHAAQPYEFKTDLTYCPSSDVPTDQCHTCIVLARLDSSFCRCCVGVCACGGKRITSPPGQES